MKEQMMEKISRKQNILSETIYNRLVDNEAELTSYLKYIRHKPLPLRMPIFLPQHLSVSKKNIKTLKSCHLIKPYVEDYLKLVKEATNLQSISSRKIIKKMIHYLEEFPTIDFLIEVDNLFGKQKKRLCFNQLTILKASNDEMIPLFQKITEQVETLKKEADDKKLSELGHRISHLQKMVELAKKQVINQENPLRVLQEQRIENYLILQQNIARAEKNYGKLSLNFQKNQQLFSSINKVHVYIKQSRDYQRS